MRTTCWQPPSEDWQELLHEHRDALWPLPVLKRWQADDTQAALLTNAGRPCASVYPPLLPTALPFRTAHERQVDQNIPRQV